MADTEIPQEILRAQKLGQEIVTQFSGVPTATVLMALSYVIAHTVENLAVRGTTLNRTMDLLRQGAEIEIAEMRRSTFSKAIGGSEE